MSKTYYRRLLSVSLVCLLTVSSVYGDINIDGILDEPEWEAAVLYSDFVTAEPLTGSPAKYSTQVRMITNEEGLFFGFTNFQPESVKRIARRFPRDAYIASDRNIIGLDFEGAAITAYDFTVGASNSRSDGIMGSGGYSNDWDGTWYSQTSSEGDYWFAEVHIPWSVAPMSTPEDGTKNISVWFSRVVFNESLTFTFPDAYYSRARFMEDWHSVEIDQAETSTLDWFPYISYRNEMQRQGEVGSEDTTDIGLDFVWRPNGSTQVTGALKPDFGQVESDNLVVNFSAFETFVAEKRPFFTENQGLFSSQLPNEDRVLYTRRIGSGASTGDSDLVDIDVAAKVTYFGEKYDTGLFIVTEENTVNGGGGDYLSSRIQRKSTDLVFGHRLTYADKPALDRQATVQVFDADWRPSETINISAQLLHSDIQQQANSRNQNIDVDDQDFAGWMGLSYSPNDKWQQELYLSHYGDAFNMNDLGYMRRNDFNEFYGSTRYAKVQYDKESSFLSSTSKIEYGYTENTQGDRLELWANFEHEQVFKSTRKVMLHLGGKTSDWDDRITRGNGNYLKPHQYWAEAMYFSPPGDDFSFMSKIEIETDGLDKPSLEMSFKPKIYLTDNVTLGGRLSYRKYREWLIWDSEIEQLASFEADSYYADMRVDWYPSNRQEFRIKFQWVGIDASEVDSYRLNSEGELFSSAVDSSDFSYSDIALQVRYRFQLAPLSDIFVVYSRGGYFGSDSGDEGPKTLLDESWSGVQVESVIAKIRYRF